MSKKAGLLFVIDEDRVKPAPSNPPSEKASDQQIAYRETGRGKPLSVRRQNRRTPMLVRRVSRQEVTLAFAAPLLCSGALIPLFGSAIFGMNESAPHFQVSRLVFYVGGPLLAAIFGAMIRNKRRAALSGALLGFGLISAIVIGDPVGAFEDWKTLLFIALLFSSAGAHFALIAAIMQRRAQRSRNRATVVAPFE